MSTFTISGLTGEQIQRLAHLIQSCGAADHGARRTVITLSDAPYSLTDPSGHVTLIEQGNSPITVTGTWPSPPPSAVPNSSPPGTSRL